MIKEIFDEIANESSTNEKMVILSKYKDNELLKRVLYLANSGRVKFYIKRIPGYQYIGDDKGLEWALDELTRLTSREFTGGAAINHLVNILSSINLNDQYIIQRIIEKDCKFGMGRSNINKVIPKLIEKTSYMGCLPFEAERVIKIFDESNGKGALCEIKADGRYCNVEIQNGGVTLTSRQGEETLLEGSLLVEELSKFKDCVLNGELIIPNIRRELSNGLITSIIDIQKKLSSDDPELHKKAQASIDKMLKRHNVVYENILKQIEFVVWDILTLDDYYSGVNKETRVERLTNLAMVLVLNMPEKITLVEHKLVKSYTEAIEYFNEALARDEEGVIVKALDGVWRDGKHGKQIKLKVEFTIDLKITKFNYGNKGTKNENVISSLTCESSCGQLVANAHGITEDIMDYITENQDTLIGTIVEVKCNGLTTNQNGGNSVNYPALKGFRTDKTTADSLEECIVIDQASKGLV